MARLWVVAVAFVALLVPGTPPASAAEKRLWRTGHDYWWFERDAQARQWHNAASRAYDACEDGENARTALGRARVPGRFLKSVKFLIMRWDFIQSLAGYDNSCDVGYKFTKVGLDIGSIGQFCDNVVLRCPKRFRVVERGTKEARKYLPDVCRWRIGIGGRRSATATIRTPCI